MSGSTIGGIVGGVIGWFVGGPAGAQWGFMIGSAVGAIVAPEQFEGPRLAEAKTQTANDGVPLIYGYGTFPCAGNLAWVDEVKEHKETESQKGGPEVTTYTYTVSYMIVVCQGEISGYKLIKRNGKIVYDARTDAELSALGYSSNEIAETRANQAAFLQRATLYYGTQTQMPDPTMVAVEGAGNVPAYTGIAYVVLKDDETREGEVSQYEFVVANCGDRSDGDPIAQILVTGSPNLPDQPCFYVSDASPALSFTPLPRASGADISGGIPGFYDGRWIVAASGGVRYAYGDLAGATWSAGSQPFSPSHAVGQLAWGDAGWLLSNASIASQAAKSGPLSASFELYEYDIVRPATPTYSDQSMWMARHTGDYYYCTPENYPGYLARSASLDRVWEGLFRRGDDSGNPNLATISAFYDIVEWQGSLYASVHFNPISNSRRQLRRSDDGGKTWPTVLVDVDANTVSRSPWQLVDGGDVLLCTCRQMRYVYTSADNFSAAHPTGIAMDQGSGGASSSWGRMCVFAHGRFYLLSGRAPTGETSLGNKCVSTEEGFTFTSPVSIPMQDSKGIAVGGALFSALVPIPDAPGHYINRFTGEFVGPSGTQIDPCQPTLGEIVADQCGRRGVTSRDVSELNDQVGGYRVAAPSTPQRNIQGLQPGYFFSASEFDGTLHFPKRGRALTFALTHDDFVERDGDPIQWERTQEPELLRKVTVGYVDPDTTYTATTQMAERRAATISAEGESTIELAVTGSKDWAAQAADKSIKVAWGEPDECTFHVSIEHAELVTGAEGTVPYMDGTTTAIRIDRIEDEGLVRMVTGRRTRANIYESNASGIAKPLPRFPGSSMRGPTDGLLMNIPLLVDANDVPGIHWAAAGMLSGWQGCILQILRAGQWLTAGTLTTPAAMGTLVAPLPYHAGDIDTANVLRLRMNDSLESVSFLNLLQERNPMAIMRDDGTAEIIQFQSAAEVSAGEFELTTLLRNRLDSGSSAHDVGARAVLLDSRVMYAPLELSDIGQTLTYRFVSLGTDPDAAEVLTLDLNAMESQREWPVFDLQVEPDGDDFHVSWRRRDRLGTDAMPIRSGNWSGYQVGWSYGGNSHSEVVTGEFITFTLPGASDITFSVSQLNQYTGAGPAETVHIP